MNLSEFISQVKKYGVPLSSKFSVSLPAINAKFSDPRELNILCNSSSLPSQSINVSPLSVYGEKSYLASGVDYGQFQLTFFVNSKFDVHKYFENWMNIIYDKNFRSYGYYRSYAKDLKLNLLDRGANTRYSVVYRECFPVNISTSGVSYDNNQPLVLSVTFVYKWWETEEVGEPVGDPDPYAALKDNSASALRAFDNDTIKSFTEDYNGNGLAAAKFLGPVTGSNALSAAIQAANGVKNLSNLSDSTPVGSLMSKYFNQLGTASSVIGNGIGDIGSGLGTILAPVQAIAGGVTSMSTVLKQTDNLLSRLGINTNISKVANSMNDVAGIVSVVGQLNGIPGALSSLGSVMGSVGGEIIQIQKSLANVPGGTKQIGQAVGNFGQVTSSNAEIYSRIAGMGNF